MIEHAKEMMGMNIELRKLLDSDRETYFELENETWVNKRMLQDEEANDRSWKAMFADTEAHYAVLMGDQICGFASILKLGEEVQEFGLELFERFRHQGIGYAALVRLLEICKNEYHVKKLRSKVYPDNFPSILLMRKIGGTPYEITENPCIEESLRTEFQKDNAELISDNVKRMAELFGVEPELLLSNLLVFQIPLQPAEIRFSLSLTGDLSYEKKIETKAINHMYQETTRILKSILEKAKNGTEEDFRKEMMDVIENLESRM